MRKGQQKFISLLLVLMCFLSCINTGTVFARAGTVTDHQAIVLVLDTSGSMYGTSIINLKKAALEFCKKILDSDKNNQIAIVAFASKQKTYDFSNNLTELEQNISSFDANGGTNMENAIKSADTLLQKDTFKNGYAKSIVLCSDGIPQSGGTSSNGQYTNKDSNYYKYANYVYNIAHEIMTKGSNIYTLGFFHNLYGQDLEFANRFMNDIQNGGYFEANNVGELIEQFKKVAEEILPLFEIELSYESVPTTILNSKDDPYYTITITAKVTNTGEKEATNAKVKIKLPAGIELLSSESIEKELGNIGDITSGTNVAMVTWKATGKIPSANKDYQYSVVAGADNVVALEKFQTITLTPDIKYSKILNTSDMWGFPHANVGTYELDKKYQDFLINNQNNSNKENLKKQISNDQNSTWGGSCHGMTKSAILFKTGLLTPSFWSNTKNTINELNISETRNLINYYYFTQFTTEYKNAKTDFAKLSIEQKLNTLKTLTEKVKNGGTPVLLSFGWNESEGWWIFKSSQYHGHAIIAYDVQTAKEYNGNKPWVIENKNYTTRIVTYDINTNEGVKDSNDRQRVENSYLYITDDGKDWTIPNYISTDEADKSKTINLATNDINLINNYNIEKMNYVSDYAQNKYAYLSATHKRAIVNGIISNGTKSSIVSGSDILGDLDIWSFYDEMENKTLSNSVTYAMENLSSSYSYEPINSTDDINLSMSYENCGFMVYSQKLTKAKFTPEKSVAVKNNGGNTELKMTLNDGYYELPWYTIGVNSNNSKEISLTKHNDGFLVDGDNLKEITITGNNDIETKELTFSTTEDNVFIGESNNELTVSIDKDKDGTYETVIADSGKKNTEKKTAELNNLETENFTLTPAFVATVRDYTSTVDYSVSKVSLTPTLEKGTKATISVNGSKAVAFDEKQAIDLKVGKNKIEIVVSGRNLTNNTYTIIVTRSKAKEIQAQDNNSNKNTDSKKINYTDKSPNTGNYIAKMSLVTAFVLVSLGVILFTHLRFKAKRKKNL